MKQKTITPKKTTSPEKIKSFEEACKVEGLDPDKVLPDVSGFPSIHQKALTALAKLIIVVDVLNGDWNPDWNNDDEYKYYPWFDMEKTKENPSGFWLISVGYISASSGVGSRLCFHSRELAEHAAEHFLDLYRDYMII